MLPPGVEARFRKIEDDLAVTAELQRRAELRAKDDVGHLQAIQNAMARWLDRMADRQETFEQRQAEFETKLNALIDLQFRSENAAQEMKLAVAAMSRTVAELSQTVDRFLKSRTDGGAN